MKDDYDAFTERMTSFDMTLEPEGEPAAHDSLDFDDVLEHYGVKGMRWGVRKRDKAPAGPADIQVKVAPGKVVKAKGGERHTPTDEAITKAVLRQKARASTLDALTNEELQVLTKRMQLEANYLKLVDGAEARKGKSFLDKFLDKEMTALKKGEAGPTSITISGVKKVLEATKTK